MKDYEIMLAPEISNLILQKLQSESLRAIHLGGFNYSQNFYDKLLFQITSTRSLDILSLEGYDFWNYFSTKGISNLEKNKSLTLLAFSGIKETENNDIQNFKISLSQRNNRINFLHSETSLVTKDFKVFANSKSK